MKKRFSIVALLLSMIIVTSIMLVSCIEEEDNVVKRELLPYSTDINYMLEVSIDTLVLDGVVTSPMATINVQKDFIQIITLVQNEEGENPHYMIRTGETTTVYSDTYEEIRVMNTSFDLVRSSILAGIALIFEGYEGYLVQDSENINLYTVDEIMQEDYYTKLDTIIKLGGFTYKSLLDVPDRGVVHSMYTAQSGGMTADAPFALVTNLSCETTANTADIAVPDLS